MSSIFDSHRIDISCPNCGKKHPKTIGWVKANSKIACACGSAINFDKSKFTNEITKADRVLASFPKKININF